MKWFISRLMEPSSHAGLAGVSYGVNAMVNGDFSFGSIATTVFGLAAFVVPEATPVLGALASLVPQSTTASNGDAGSRQ